jgi:uncharacterized membrane protein YraQ (UPF0718 family)
MKREFKVLAALVGIFLVAYLLPLGNTKIQEAIIEAFRLLQWYTRNHTLPRSNPILAYAVASVAGCVLAVCSCSVLPMFAGIYSLGAGLGPATAFLYSGPGINVLAIFLSARVLGFDIGAGRFIGAVVFSVVVGLLMAWIFRKGERAKAEAALQMPEPEKPRRHIGKTALFLASMILFLIFSDWYNPGNVVVKTTDGQQFKAVVIHETKDMIRFQLEENLGENKTGDKIELQKTEIDNIQEQETWIIALHHIRWYLAGLCGLAVLIMAWQWFEKDELREWMHNTWEFTKMLVPLLFGGVFVVGFVSVLLPEKQVAQWVGDNSLRSNLVASIIGAFWYFATLTEIPITQALMKLGMHKGPVLALLLAGPALSLPSMIVILRIMGTKKTVVFILLVIIMATITGMFFGAIWG